MTKITRDRCFGSDPSGHTFSVPCFYNAVPAIPNLLIPFLLHFLLRRRTALHPLPKPPICPPSAALLRKSRSVKVEAMAAENARDPRIDGISSAIRAIPDFPKPGISFQDITTLLLDTKAFKDTIDLFVERYKDKEISVVAGIEARGFIFGPPIALAIGAKFVPMRKPNKLPGKVISEEYSLEYGTDIMEMHVGAVEAGDRALIIDDLIATGGTLGAAIRLLERVGVNVVECACVIELPELKGRDRLGDRPLFVLVDKVGADFRSFVGAAEFYRTA